MSRFSLRYSLALALGLAVQAGWGASAQADDCSRFAAARDSYLGQTSDGMTAALEQMARQRQIPVDAAAFYWGGTLLQADDRASLASLAQLTLATYQWQGHWERAEHAMTRIADEHGSRVAALYAGLMFTDNRGARDPYRARAYLAESARGGNRDAAAFLDMHDACSGHRMALN
ncbi:hypothetical protein [Maricaulis salignorans]|uniref:Sel1 repeat-containing protein n=1 Tax=Maricaulis salignorans TaxID=144026 RepID=A0A1G9RYQ2_9PROT|nr:hypothetical protein [Maricaulis salignorans]SDM28389.1 hypothetical protein SAMN04488568_10846 [Maricaulis salignorans]